MSSTAVSDPLDLVAVLRAERDAYRAFCQLLQEETAALEQGDADALLGIAQRKSAQVAHLAHLGEARNQQLRTMTGMTDRLGIDAWCERHDPAGRHGAAGLWQELLAAAGTARRLNEENGALIHLRLQHNQAALSVLRGAARQTAEFYGPDGQPRSTASGRPLGKA